MDNPPFHLRLGTTSNQTLRDPHTGKYKYMKYTHKHKYKRTTVQKQQITTTVQKQPWTVVQTQWTRVQNKQQQLQQ